MPLLNTPLVCAPSRELKGAKPLLEISLSCKDFVSIMGREIKGGGFVNNPKTGGLSFRHKLCIVSSVIEYLLLGNVFPLWSDADYLTRMMRYPSTFICIHYEIYISLPRF